MVRGGIHTYNTCSNTCMHNIHTYADPGPAAKGEGGADVIQGVNFLKEGKGMCICYMSVCMHVFVYVCMRG